MQILDIQAPASAAETAFVDFVIGHAPNPGNPDEGEYALHAGSFVVQDAVQLVPIDRVDFSTHIDVRLDEDEGALFSRQANVDMYAADILVRTVALSVGSSNYLYDTLNGDTESQEIPHEEVDSHLTTFLGLLTRLEENGFMQPLRAVAETSS